MSGRDPPRTPVCCSVCTDIDILIVYSADNDKTRKAAIDLNFVIETQMHVEIAAGDLPLAEGKEWREESSRTQKRL